LRSSINSIAGVSIRLASSAVTRAIPERNPKYRIGMNPDVHSVKNPMHDVMVV
jgi:hypothetical protein